MDGLGEAWQERCSEAGLGLVGRGSERQEWQEWRGEARHGLARHGRNGPARRGAARHGRRGEAQSGVVQWAQVWHGEAGMVGRGKAERC